MATEKRSIDERISELQEKQKQLKVHRSQTVLFFVSRKKVFTHLILK